MIRALFIVCLLAACGGHNNNSEQQGTDVICEKDAQK